MLVAVHGVLPDQTVNLRHEGKGYDSFIPMPVAIPAAQGARRVAGRAKLAEMRVRRSEKKPEPTTGMVDGHDTRTGQFSGLAHGLDMCAVGDQVSQTPAGQSGAGIDDWRKEAETQRPPMRGDNGGRY